MNNFEAGSTVHGHTTTNLTLLEAEAGRPQVCGQTEIRNEFQFSLAI